MAEIEHRTIQANGVALHVALAGPEDGPLIVLLHGFPEFWFEWRELIPRLAEAGFRVAAPDQRGYNTSEKPKGAHAYRLDVLADDIFALATALGRERFQLVGHDWGAAVAWWMATRNGARIERLAIMNAAHPAVWRAAMTEDPEQRAKSRYVQMLRIPALPELIVKLGGYKGLSDAFKSSTRPEAFGPETMAEYMKAWKQPGAVAAGINWYRALFMQDLPVPAAGSLAPPTLILWGDQDPFGAAKHAEASAALCRDARVYHFRYASHWLPHDEPEKVAGALLAFLAKPGSAPG